MILPDVNVLIGAFRVDSDRHEVLRPWLLDAFASGRPVALAAPALTGFLRVVTDQRIFSAPSRLDVALDFVERMLAQDTARLVDPGARHWTMLADLLRAADARGRLVPDAHLATLAIEHGATVATRDRGFARFPGVSWFDPTAEA